MWVLSNLRRWLVYFPSSFFIPFKFTLKYVAAVLYFIWPKREVNFLKRLLGGKKKPGFGQPQAQQSPQPQPAALGKGQKQQQQQQQQPASKGPKKTGVSARYHGEMCVVPMVTLVIAKICD